MGPATRAAINGDSCAIAARDARAAQNLAVAKPASLAAPSASGYDQYLGQIAAEVKNSTTGSNVSKTIASVNTAVVNKVAGTVAALSAARSASAMGTCVNLTDSLHRGNESATVKKLQEFLYQKGFLTEQPTGFFGDLTIAAVKAYQKSVGIKETGMVFDLTRQMIRGETCDN